MTLVEGLTGSTLNEIEIGGGISPSVLDDMREKNHHVDKPEYAGQGELFPGKFPDLAKIHGTLSAPYKMVGRIDGFVVGLKTDEEQGVTTYVVFSEGTAIAWVSFRHKPIMPYTGHNMHHDLHGIGAQVCGVNVHPDHTGKRLALKLYKFVLENVYDYIIADATQSMGGVKLWKMLNNSRAFDVLVYDPRVGYSRKRWSGKDLDGVYKNDDLILWATLAGRGHQIDSGQED